MDEVELAGGYAGTNNTSYYLYTGQDYWTMSPSYFYNYNIAQVFCVYTTASLGFDWVSYEYGVRPVINLKAGTTFKTGTDGTYSAPYEVM